ncbi:MAG: hypothetical protein MJY69_05980 [Bacteroidales bacterium]|nr:hypothetical protein [Bacteroidales bacterium]
MKYLLRAVKYYVYLVVILAIVISALVAFKVIDGDLSTMFVNGYDSYWQMALLLAVFSAVYPRFGFSSRKAYLKGAYEELRPAVMEVMGNHGYVLESEDGENLTFRKKSALSRVLKMCEDRITYTRDVTGFELEGLTRDLPRLVSALEYRTSDL